MKLYCISLAVMLVGWSGSGWGGEISWSGRMTETAGADTKESRVWVQGEKFRVERRHSGGSNTVYIYDGRVLYRFPEQSKVATLFDRSRARDVRAWDSMGRFGQGEGSLEGSAMVGNVPCEKTSFSLPATKDQTMTVHEWVSPSLGRVVLKRTQAVGAWISTLEMKDLVVGIPEDPSRFILPEGMQIRTPLPRTVGPKDFVGTPIEDFVLKAADRGDRVTLSQVYGTHRAVLVNFFATWCGPCRKETPDMVEVFKKYQDQGVAFLSVDVGEKGDATSKVRDYVKEFGVTWPVVWDDQNYNDRYAAAIPTNLLVDHQGIIRAYRLGGTTKEWFEQELEKLLHPDAPSNQP